MCPRGSGTQWAGREDPDAVPTLVGQERQDVDPVNGVMPPKAPRVQPKKEATASGIFGVAAPTDATTCKRMGKMMVPLRYKKTVLGKKEFDNKWNAFFKAQCDEKRASKFGRRGARVCGTITTGQTPLSSALGLCGEKRCQRSSTCISRG